MHRRCSRSAAQNGALVGVGSGTGRAMLTPPSRTSATCSLMIPPLPETKAMLQSATWAAPARPVSCRTASQTWCIPPAMPACPNDSWPPAVFTGKSPRKVRSCSATNFIPSPFAQKPASSRVITTVIV